MLLSAVDRLFIATKSGAMSDLKDFPERDLARFEFYEIIVRMAGIKYKESGKCETYAQAVKMLIEDDLMTYFNVNKWQHWRETQLWTLDVNDLFEANLEALKKIFKTFFTTKKSSMDLTDSINLLIKNANLMPTEKEVIQCYGMSKMTLPNEIAKRKEYNALQFVEFLEFLARAAEVRHKVRGIRSREEDKSELDSIKIESSFDKSVSAAQADPQTRNATSTLQADQSSLQRMSSTLMINDGVTLTKKIEDFLDEIFPSYHVKRKEVKIEIEFETDSDDDDE